MKTYNLFTNKEVFFKSAKADFILASTDKTQEDIFSSTKLEYTEDGTPTSSVIIRAVNNLLPFSQTTNLNLNYLNALDAKSIVRAGMDFACSYELKGNYVILAQNDSFKELASEQLDNFEVLNEFSNKSILFYVGFILEASRRFHIVLSGGVEMATCLLIADRLRETLLMRIKSDNITLGTSKFSKFDKYNKLTKILSQLSYTQDAISIDFSFANTEIGTLQRYNEKAVQSNTNAGGALMYGDALTNQELLDAIELIIYAL